MSRRVATVFPIFMESRESCLAADGRAWKVDGRAQALVGPGLAMPLHATIVKKKLYLSLIRYCSQIWRPFLRKDILFIEKIQRRATKYILNDYNSSYKSCLIQLKLLPLLYLFDFNDLIFS